ncbi:MAG: hypothetical protein IKH30_01670 [Clostridia bacterium]|nr:hypothetical protein [Clostridia bacterium]MBR4537252.1 hypothetical protein [Clostridia bacterium]MBR4540517.1 hypothetical protein [Clostridia bacterium]
MAYLGDIQMAGTPQTVAQLWEYVRALEREIRRVTEDLGNENIRDGAIAQKKLEEPLVRGMKKAEDTTEGLAKLEKRLTDAIKRDREKMDAAGMGTNGMNLDAATANPPIFSGKISIDKDGVSVKQGGALNVFDPNAEQMVNFAPDAAKLHRGGWVEKAQIVSGALVLTLSDGTEITYGGN